MKDNRLESWKEIAKYLNIEVRTCQRWEKKFGLPIKRYTDSPKSRVYSTNQEIDEWLGKTNINGENQSNSKLRFNKFHLALLLVLVLLLFGMNLFNGNSNPSSFKIEQSELVILNKSKKELWRFDTKCENLLRTEYYKQTFQTRKITIENTVIFPLISISDINSDGKNEVVFVPHSTDLKNSNRLIILDSKGKKISEIITGGKLKFGYLDYSKDFLIEGFQLYDINNDGESEILIKSNHIPMFPTQFLIIDINGIIQGEYWNAGRISDFVVVDSHIAGIKKIFFSGINNEYEKGFVAVFISNNVSGCSPQLKDHYKMNQCDKGSELFYILFPRTELDLMDNLHGNCNMLTAHADGNVTAQLKHTKNLYQFDSEMRFKDLKFSDTFKFNHNKEVHNSRIKTSLNKEYKIKLANNLLYFNGNSYTTSYSKSNPE